MTVQRTRQDKIHTLGSAINDTLTPSDHDANAVDLEDTNNFTASQINAIVGSGNWEDAPAASLAQLDALTHLNEKEALREIILLTNITVPAAVAATGTLTGTANMANGETVTIDGKVYTFQTVLTDVDGNVLIGAALTDSLDNIRAAINLDAGAGTLYANSTTLHPTVSAVDTPTTIVVTAKSSGSAANVIATTETGANMSWGSATLSGGAGDAKILSVAGSETPSGRNKAIAVTTLGLVTATHTGIFGDHSLDELVGLNPLEPRNCMVVFDATTGEQVVSSNSRKIFALLQNESGATDGTLFTDTTPERAQISFVEPNATFDDLVATDATDIGGLVIRLEFIDREVLDAWNEQDFLTRTTRVDAGTGATVTLDIAIDNQGTTPATQLTDIFWRIDDTKALNFQDSTGARNLVKIAPDVASDEVEFNVDTLDVNVGAAGVVDIDNGVTVDSGGTPINLGVTAGQIDATVLKLAATAGLAELEGIGVTLDALTGPLIADGTFLDADFSGDVDSHLIHTANSGNDRTFNLASRNVGAGKGDLELEADDDILFETVRETTPLPLDDSVAGAISALVGGPYASVSAAISSALTSGGVNLFFTIFEVTSNVNQGVNIPGATLDLTTFDQDMGTPATPGTPDLFIFLNGRILRGAAAAGTGGWFPGTTPGNGDFKNDFPKGLKTGDILITIAFN